MSTATDRPVVAPTTAPPVSLEGRHVEVVVIGGGQAGLSLSWHLVRAGVDHVVLERETAAHDWADRRWDAFTLVTPNWQCQLPGYPYAGDDPDGFMAREEVVAWLRAYPSSFGAPLLEGVAVTSLRTGPDGGYEVTTSAGRITADQAVVATGGYHQPVLPAASHRLPDDLVQLHSAGYRSPGALPRGAVLVIGSGQSGAQIAEDLHLAGREVHLALGSAPRVARRYRGRDCVAWLHDMGVYDVGIEAHAGGLSKRESTNHYVTGRGGGRDIDLRAFAAEGMHLHGRLESVEGPRLRFTRTTGSALDAADAVADSIKDDIDRWIAREGIGAPPEARYTPVWRPPAPQDEVVDLDLRAAGVTSVVWAVGFRADFRWVQVGVFDGTGAPTHRRGTTSSPGLHFLGLPWLHTWGSGRFAGIARDAEHLAAVVVERAGARPAERPAAHQVRAPSASLQG